MKKLLIIFLVFICDFYFSQVNLASGLQACYGFAGNANDPINGLNGVLGNVTPDVDRFNNPNQSYYFNSSPGAFITLPDDARIKAQAMSVSAWVYVSGGFPAYIAFTKNMQNPNAFFEAYALGMNGTNFTASKVNGTGMYNLVSSNPISFNSWYHLTLTVDQSDIKLYVNGVLDASMSAPGPIDYDPTKNVYLGGSNEIAWPAVFNGRIDNVRFYNRVLNAAEVNSLFTTDPACQSLVAPSFYYCGNTNLNINTSVTEASDNNANYNYYRFEFSNDASFSEHAVIGSPLSNKFSIELTPANKSPLLAPTIDQVTGIQYSQTYYARVKVKMALSDPWSTPGPACTFTTYCPGTPIIPKYYFQFENNQYQTACQTYTNPLCDPCSGGYNRYYDVMRNECMRSYYGTSYPSTGQVGAANTEMIDVTGIGTAYYLSGCGYAPGSDQSVTTGFTAEFLIKPDISKGNSWNMVLNFSTPNVHPYIVVGPGNFDFNIRNKNDPNYPGVTSQQAMAVNFIPNFPGMFSNDYLNDGNWHHLAFVYDGINNKMQIWIDAVLLPGFEISIPANTAIYFPDNIGANYAREYNGLWDEFAVYDKALTPQMIYQHYVDMQRGNHYNFCTNYTPSNLPTVPVANCPPLNPNEYSPGSVDPDQQLYAFPTPRYLPGHGLKPNFPYTDIVYLSRLPSPGNLFPNPTNNVLLNVNEERARKWNYYLELPAVKSNWTAYNTYSGLGTQWINQVNNLSHYPTSTILYESYSSSGVPLGSVPVASASGDLTNPNNAMITHGKSVSSLLNNNIVQYLNRDLSIVNMDEESFDADGLSPGNYNTTGPIQRDIDISFKTGLLYTGPSNAFGSNKNHVTNTAFTKYRINAYDSHLFPWTIAATEWNYSTMDVYTSPTHWLDGNPASHGLRTYELGRNLEMFQPNTQLCSPFVSANYSIDENSNMKPSQYLAALKSYAMLGAEFYYVGYFNQCKSACLGTPANYPSCNSTCAWPNATGTYYNNILYVTDPGGPNDPRHYLYQLAMPSYAQAVTSRYEDILRSSALLNGLNAIDYSNIKYRFTEGSEVVYARQYLQGNNPAQLFVINGSIMLNNNCSGFEPDEKTQTIKFGGWFSPSSSDLSFKIRRQGSTYIYDNRDVNNVLFFQLDKWHEVSHPWNWSKDFKFEAEVYDDIAYTSNSNKIKLKTEVPVGTTPGDYSNFTTFVQYPTGSTKKTTYYFEPRDQNNATNSTQYYIWVRARRNNAPGNPAGNSSLDVQIKRENNTNPNTLNPPMNVTVFGNTIPCIDNSGWKWYSVGFSGPTSNPAQTMQFTGTSTHLHEIQITGNDPYVEFDQFIISTVAPPGLPDGVTASEVAVYCGSNNRTIHPATEEAEEVYETGVGCSVYPSPSTGEFTIKLDNRLERMQEIHVTNILGQEIITLDGLNDLEKKIAISNLANSGVLFITVKSEGRTYKSKVVLVK